MLYYQEITLIDQGKIYQNEISSYFIWSKLYTQLHLALVKIQNQDGIVNIGVSFPQFIYQKEEKCKPKINLGTSLRLFAKTEEELQTLNILNMLERLMDYLHISPIRLVPQDKITAYVKFNRKQFKTNPERLARHRVKTRNDISFDEAVKLYQNRITFTDLPYIEMKSLTNNRRFKLFIEKNISEKSNGYKFNTYGLSSESTVPDF